MMHEPDVTYYALRGLSETKVGGILRRTRTGAGTTDETFRRDLSWGRSEFMRRYELGRNNLDFEEITKEEAERLIAAWTAKWAQEDQDT